MGLMSGCSSTARSARSASSRLSRAERFLPHQRVFNAASNQPQTRADHPHSPRTAQGFSLRRALITDTWEVRWRPGPPGVLLAAGLPRTKMFSHGSQRWPPSFWQSSRAGARVAATTLSPFRPGWRGTGGRSRPGCEPKSAWTQPAARGRCGVRAKVVWGFGSRSRPVGRRLGGAGA
jgi:hypothetical protein